MFNQKNGVAGLNEFLQGLHQLEYVVEVQASRGFVKDKERVFALSFEGISEVLGELETLGFAAGQGRNRLAELEIIQADFNERLKITHDFLVLFEELNRFSDRHVEHFGDVGLFAVTRQLDLEDLIAVAGAFAFRAA